jgi:hypothetical protein
MFKRVMAAFGVVALVASILAVNADVLGQTQNRRKKPERQLKQNPERQLPPQALPYTPGEAKFTINGDQNPIIRLAMAASGVTIVEFPAEDKFFAVHPPGNGDWIEVEKSPSQKTDTHLVLRPGKDLMNMPGPAASISVQMRSGLVVTLWTYPVRFITQQTHRCVISYDPNKIVEARRRAGLAVNLGGDEEREVAKAAESDNRLTKPPETVPAPTPPAPAPPLASSPDGAGPTQRAVPRPAAPEPIKETQKETPSEQTLKALRGLLKDGAANPKGFKHWSEATNGLRVATQVRDLDDRVRVALVAVENVEADEAIRLLTGHPDLIVQTLDGKGKIIQLERVKQLHAESTTSNNVIPARSTVYFAIAFAPPTLGKQQRLTVTVGHKNAADDPAIAGLSAKKK